MAKRMAGSQIDNLITKSQELHQFPFMQVACHIPLESSRRGLQLFFKTHFNRKSTHKVMGPNVVEVPVVGILGLLLGCLETKCHLGAGLVARHIIYYKGEGGAFSQVWAVVSLVSLVNLSLPMAHPNIKSVLAMH
jgi:hypothetical protein